MPRLTPQRFVYTATILYGAVFTASAAARYYSYGYSRFDLGNMVQAIWSTAHGHILESTNNAGGQFVRLGAHTDVFLLLFVPIWWVSSSPLILVVVQAIAVSIGALPVYWLARKHLGDGRVPVFFALAYLLFPATQYNAFASPNGFHSVSVAIPLLLYAIWFLDNDRLIAFAIVGTLAATTKEQMPLVVGLLGLWYAMRYGRRLFGFSVFALGMAITLVNFLVILPHYAAGTYLFRDRYEDVGGSPGGMAHTLFSDPGAFVTQVATGHKLAYLILMLGPFLGLWLLEPWLMLAATPDLVLNLLSARDGQTWIKLHYNAAIIPIVVAATVLGLARLGKQTQRLGFYVFVLVLVLSVISPIRGVYFEEAFGSGGLRHAKAHALSLVPPHVAVSVTNHLGGYASNRLRVLDFPVVRDVNWAIVDQNDIRISDFHLAATTLQEMRTGAHWRLVYSSHGINVFRRVHG